MTEKQKLFCDEYLIDLNGTRAYRTVYKTIKNDNVAGVRANKLLKQKDIAEYINKRLEEIHNENTANIQEVIAKPPDEKERLKAAELLGKRFGMFKDNIDITSNGQTVIVDDIDEG